MMGKSLRSPFAMATENISGFRCAIAVEVAADGAGDYLNSLQQRPFHVGAITLNALSMHPSVKMKAIQMKPFAKPH